MARVNNKINKLINNYSKQVMKQAEKDIDKVINEVNNELYNEVIHMYDTLIDQFYAYKTSSYIRHGETRPGTGMGINLYRANSIYKKNGKNPILTIQINADNMEGGYQHDTKYDVLNYVLSGIRFPFDGTRTDADGRRYPISNFGASGLRYHGRYFNYKGNIDSIFKEFDNDFKNISSNMFYNKWRKTKWFS